MGEGDQQTSIFPRLGLKLVKCIKEPQLGFAEDKCCNVLVIHYLLLFLQVLNDD